MDLLRIATAGSVDDGKSTLIGRLLYDSKALSDDVVAAVEDASRRQRSDYVNLALVTDGLRAEREQGITIDVAYRYFSTPVRKFILADTPGHVQYTRNMVTGASTADAALIMVDARNGVVEQSRRHAAIASLLGIDHIVVCVNKMDLVGHSEAVFASVRAAFTELMNRLGVTELTCIPMAALHGDNVVERSARMPWYTGPALLEHLERLPVREGLNALPLRLPVQLVVRPHRTDMPDYRGYAGSIASGTLRVGQTVALLPSGRASTVTGITAPWGPVQEARVPDAVTVTLADDLDVGRGETLADPASPPPVALEHEAVLCWMDERAPLRAGGVYRLKHGTRTVKVQVSELSARFNPASLTGEHSPPALALNDIGQVRLRASAPLAADPYTANRATGAFILISEATNATVAAGMLGAPRFPFVLHR
jgi:bifunctional enzyme CysN/CysC